MKPNLSRQAKGVMGPFDGPVHRQATRYVWATIPKPDFFNVGDEEVFHC